MNSAAAPVVMDADCTGCGRTMDVTVPDSRETSLRERSRIRCGECGAVAPAQRPGAADELPRRPPWLVDRNRADVIEFPIWNGDLHE